MPHNDSTLEGPNPSGLCLCGCGGKTPLAKRSHQAKGNVIGTPVRFVFGHRARLQGTKGVIGPNPTGKCICGCGALTPLARSSNATNGNVRGEPVRYVPGHYARSKTVQFADMDPNPSGLCMCGCGNKTPLAKKSSRKKNTVAGKPTRYIKDHVSPRADQFIVDPETNCWNWLMGISSRGYGVIHRNGKQYMAHRWMYEQRVGPVPDEHDIHHKCKNTRCVNPDHLVPLSKTAHNRLTPLIRLSVEQVCEIRKLSGTMLNREIADKFNVTTSHITNILNNKSWKDID